MSYYRYFMIILLLSVVIIINAGCGGSNGDTNEPGATSTATPVDTPSSIEPSPTPLPVETVKPEETSVPNKPEPTAETGENLSLPVVANATDITVLVNKNFRLPNDYIPADLVVPDVPFTFKEKLDKRKMRKEAAAALEQMFEAAKLDEIQLAGVSGYRSRATQKSLFNSYVARDGLEAASRYSARPGQSEHQTGLAMDVGSINGKCSAMDCFGGTKEATWVAEHAAEYGFIVRYPEGKESITGYKYEPWHLRFVGVELATEVTDKGMTLEEYYGEAVPVNN